MSLIEFIGFIISFGALIFLFTRKAAEEQKRRRNPAQYEKEQEERARALNAFYKHIDEEMGGLQSKEAEEDEEYQENEEEYEEEYSPPPPPKPLPVVQKPLPQERVQKGGSTAKLSFEPIPHFRELKNKKEMVVMYTVFGPPKSRNDWRPLS